MTKSVHVALLSEDAEVVEPTDGPRRGALVRVTQSFRTPPS
jgi:hypothetical protein